MEAVSPPALRPQRASWVHNHPLAVFMALAYSFSWACMLPLAVAHQGLLPLSPPFALHYLAAFGPLAAAALLAGMTAGSDGLRTLFSGLLRWRVGLRWYLFALGAPLGLFAAATIVDRAFGGSGPDLGLLGQVDYLPYLSPPGALALWLLTFGLGEEVGWRGYLLPRLQPIWGARGSSLVLGLFWAIWHVPAFFYRDTYIAMGLVAGLPTLLLAITAASVIFTWLYNGTHGSLLIVVLFHGVFDLLAVSPATTATATMALNVAPIVWATLLLCRPAVLTNPSAQQANA